MQDRRRYEAGTNAAVEVDANAIAAATRQRELGIAWDFKVEPPTHEDTWFDFATWLSRSQVSKASLITLRPGLGKSSVADS